MRVFVALELPSPARAALERWRGGLGSGPAALRPVAEADLHLTLCFIGEVADDAAAPIGDAVAAATAGEPAIGVSFGAALWLPRRRPRVLAVSVTGDPALAGLQDRVSRALTAGGWYTPESRPYLAHVTVARVQGAIGRPRALPAPGGPKAASFAAVSVAVVRSRLGAGPARYERLRTIELASAR